MIIKKNRGKNIVWGKSCGFLKLCTWGQSGDLKFSTEGISFKLIFSLNEIPSVENSRSPFWPRVHNFKKLQLFSQTIFFPLIFFIIKVIFLVARKNRKPSLQRVWKIQNPVWTKSLQNFKIFLCQVPQERESCFPGFQNLHENFPNLHEKSTWKQ